jgi:hypothetical protein
MASVEITPVVIHYTVAPKSVSVRVRHYAGTVAFKEDSHDVPMDAVLHEAGKAGRTEITTADVLAATPLADVKWALDAAAIDLVRGDASVSDLVT